MEEFKGQVKRQEQAVLGEKISWSGAVNLGLQRNSYRKIATGFALIESKYWIYIDPVPKARREGISR